MIKKYGVENPYQIPEVINKIAKINKEKINESLEKQRKTCLLKYGTEYYMQTNKFKEQSKITSLNKYGVEHPMKAEIIKEKYNRDLVVKKIIMTKKLHGTFNTSKDEDLRILAVERGIAKPATFLFMNIVSDLLEKATFLKEISFFI